MCSSMERATFCLLALLAVWLLYSSQLVAAEFPDQASIIAINEGIGVPGWGVNTSDYCNWSGITCSPDQAVEALDLSGQGLRGNATLLSQLKALKWLDISNNEFDGPIPGAFGDLSELEFLDLSSNRFGSVIPVELGRLRNLRAINLSDNSLSASIPDELEGLVSLQDLQISSNDLDGPIPSWIGNLTSLGVFSAYENQLNGEIPVSLGSASELQLLNLHSNELEGLLPEAVFTMGKLEVLILTQNRLSGTIPEAIGNCNGLTSIRIGNNNLTGSIPRTIGNISSLAYFEADNNDLSGEIVVEFARCSNLTLLNLASNGFTGTIPPELGQLANLQELIVSGNSLSGDIPDSILRCKNLSKLDLSGNRFNGTIPSDICAMPRLQFLLLDQNSMRGVIPSEIGNCTKLLELQLGSNYLSGTIPAEVGHLKNLQIALNLSFNHLNGPLPLELGKLDKLVSLDVSNNQLSGAIPQALKGMLSLFVVNFSDNLFSGPIPNLIPLQKSPSSSFTGNKGLCGQPLSSPCNGDDQENYSRKVSYRALATVLGSGIAVFVSVSIVVLLFMIRETCEKAAQEARTMEEAYDAQPPTTTGNVFVENLRQAIDFDAVVKATFKDSNKISSGTFSVVYKATMPSGLTLLVRSFKSMDRTIIHHQNKMIRELERLSLLSHDNLMRPIGFVIYDDVALLLHEYMPNGTLAQLLHGLSNQSDDEPDWLRRLSIAIGVAEGLAFLHSVAVIHLDVSAGNILLDANFRPLVAEIEISKLLDPSRGTASISAVAGSFGYIPPEYAFTMQVTAPGNVYSYGVILLEILTTRLPIDEAFGEGSDLVKWVHNAPSREETPEQILDARLSTVSFAWRKQMLATLKVALLCTDSMPGKRPKLKKVIEMLQEIQQS
ncbi:hypothetical protein Droror1_Dr00002474 [Drosera rotundifolia]